MAVGVAVGMAVGGGLVGDGGDWHACVLCVMMAVAACAVIAAAAAACHVIPVVAANMGSTAVAAAVVARLHLMLFLHLLSATLLRSMVNIRTAWMA